MPYNLAFFYMYITNLKLAMFEINPVKNKIADLRTRTDMLRGYL